MSGFLLWVCRIFSGLFQNFRAFRVFVRTSGFKEFDGFGIYAGAKFPGR